MVNNMSDMRSSADELNEFCEESLSGDIRDWILDRLRTEQDKRPWNERGEHEQEDTVLSATEAAKDLVRRVVEIVAAAGMPVISATIEQVTVKDGIKATLTMSRTDEQRHALIDHCGSSVKIVVADVGRFVGAKAPVEILHDQMELVPAVEE